MNNYKKGFAQVIFIAIGVVVLVGAIGTTAVIVNRNSSETKDWKTYTNTEYGFEFKYPTNLSLLENNTYASGFEYQVCVLPSPSGINCSSPYTYTEQDFEFEKHLEVLEILVGEKNDKNKNLIDQTYNVPEGMVFFSAENDNYIFKFRSYNGKSEMLSKIFSTFKSIPITNTVNTEWKTYTDNDYEFELKYPAFFGELRKVDAQSWVATNKPTPSKTASIVMQAISANSSPTVSLFSDIGGDTTGFDFNREQFFREDSRKQRTYVEKKYSNGNIYYDTSSGEGGDDWWGVTYAYFVFDRKHRAVIRIQTSNNPNTYNKGPSADEIFKTFKFVDKSATSDWKTYKNERFGFEFKYPSTILGKNTAVQLRNDVYGIQNIVDIVAGDITVSFYPRKLSSYSFPVVDGRNNLVIDNSPDGPANGFIYDSNKKVWHAITNGVSSTQDIGWGEFLRMQTSKSINSFPNVMTRDGAQAIAKVGEAFEDYWLAYHVFYPEKDFWINFAYVYGYINKDRITVDKTAEEMKGVLSKIAASFQVN